MRGDHEEHKILVQIRLIASPVNQKLRKKEGIHRFLKRFLPEKFGPFDPRLAAYWWLR